MFIFFTRVGKILHAWVKPCMFYTPVCKIRYLFYTRVGKTLHAKANPYKSLQSTFAWVKFYTLWVKLYTRIPETCVKRVWRRFGPPFRRRSHKNVFHSHAKTKEFYSTFTRFLHARQIEDFATPLNQNARLFYTRPRDASCLPGNMS